MKIDTLTEGTVAGLLATLIWAVAAWAVTKFKLGKLWKTGLALFLLFLLVTMPFAIFTLITKGTTGESASTNDTPVLLLIVLIQFLLGTSIVLLLKKSLFDAVGTSPFASPFKLTVEKGSKEWQLEVRRLLLRGQGKNKAELDWNVFGNGMCFLYKQIVEHTPTVAPDLCIGINYGGMLIASLLSDCLPRGSKQLGYVGTYGGKDHEVTLMSLPIDLEKGNIKSVIVTDFEVKSGNSLQNVCTRLRQELGDHVDIKIAVMAAGTVGSKASTMKDLLAGKGRPFKADSAFMPDFLAFITDGRVRPPDLRS